MCRRVCRACGIHREKFKTRGLSLSCIRTCAVVAEERPRLQLLNSFIKLFQTLGLNPRTVSTTFGCRVNIAICLRGASDPDPAPVYVDHRALRNDRVTLVEKGSPHSLCLLESGKVRPAHTTRIVSETVYSHVASTRRQSRDRQSGEQRSMCRCAPGRSESNALQSSWSSQAMIAIHLAMGSKQSQCPGLSDNQLRRSSSASRVESQCRSVLLAYGDGRHTATLRSNGLSRLRSSHRLHCSRRQ